MEFLKGGEESKQYLQFCGTRVATSVSNHLPKDADTKSLGTAATIRLFTLIWATVRKTNPASTVYRGRSNSPTPPTPPSVSCLGTYLISTSWHSAFSGALPTAA
jgi:hypothetical protein